MRSTTMYKRNAKGVPLFWTIIEESPISVSIESGIVGHPGLSETLVSTKKDEYNSRIKAKRKEGYKELEELRDSTPPVEKGDDYLYNYLNTYLPKYNTRGEDFVLPMLAKTLEDNKPFEKVNCLLGQYKINGLRCIIGAEKTNDIFNPIRLTYHSREGADWTANLNFMDEVIINCIGPFIIESMVEADVCLDGEMYIPGRTVNEINHAVKNPASAIHKDLQYWCYDIAVDNITAESRREMLYVSANTNVTDFINKEDHLNNKEPFVILPTSNVWNFINATELRDSFIEMGFEGLILRNPDSYYQFGKRNTAMLKHKKILDGMFEIVNIEADKRGLPIYTLKNDINGEYFNATINLTQAVQRAHLEMKASLIGKKAFVEFRERSGVKQVPFHAKIIRVYV